MFQPQKHESQARIRSERRAGPLQNRAVFLICERRTIICNGDVVDECQKSKGNCFSVLLRSLGQALYSAKWSCYGGCTHYNVCKCIIAHIIMITRRGSKHPADGSTDLPPYPPSVFFGSRRDQSARCFQHPFGSDRLDNNMGISWYCFRSSFSVCQAHAMLPPPGTIFPLTYIFECPIEKKAFFRRFCLGRLAYRLHVVCEL